MDENKTNKVFQGYLKEAKDSLDFFFDKHKIDECWTKILLLGTTGEGKTTLMHTIVGKRMRGGVDKYHLPILDVASIDQKLISEKNGEPYELGHTADAQTFLPQVWCLDQKKIAFFDCPGFFDTNLDKRLINAFSTDQILKCKGKVKVLWVVSESTLDHRVTDAMGSFDMICNMFPNKEQLQQFIGVVTTKTTGKSTSLLKKLNDAKDWHNSIYSFLVQNMKERVFDFPTAVAGSDYAFEDREKLIQFLEVGAVNMPEHQVSIDDRTVNRSINVTTDFTKKKRKELKCFVEPFDKVCNKGGFVDLDQWKEYLKELEIWKEYALRLSEAAGEGLKQLQETCTEIAPLKNLSDGLSLLVPWDEFLLSIVNNVPKLQTVCDVSESLQNKTQTLLKCYFEKIDTKIVDVKGRIALEVRYQENAELTEEMRETIEKLQGDLQDKLVEFEDYVKNSSEREDGLKEQIADLNQKVIEMVEELTSKDNESESNQREIERLSVKINESTCEIATLKTILEKCKTDSDEKFKESNRMIMELIKKLPPPKPKSGCRLM